MKFQFLIENKTDTSGCVAEHGLSIYIEAQGKRIVFDAGASELFAENAKKLGVDLSRADAMIISHGHYDHTGGVPTFCRINKDAPVYIHKEAFYETYGMDNGSIDKEPCGIRWTQEEREQIEPRLIKTEGPLWLSDNIVISGTIPADPNRRQTEDFYRRLPDERLVPDEMAHEQILVVREPEGLYVFSGCSHRGVIPAVSYARELFGGERIAVLTAGMHLYSAGQEMREKVIGQILSEKLDTVIPVHCTGINAICDLKAALGAKCIAAATGSSYGN
ncbi:MAG: MBL fold metallo-hydrolase [Firmicutes bacterium]|nr:MBL fold metallo-hydrolase [Bacillota bacterium]